MKGISSDFNLAYQRIHCNECYEERQKVEAAIARLREHEPQSARLADLRKEADEIQYLSSTIDPDVNK